MTKQVAAVDRGPRVSSDDAVEATLIRFIRFDYHMPAAYLPKRSLIFLQVEVKVPTFNSEKCSVGELLLASPGASLLVWAEELALASPGASVPAWAEKLVLSLLRVLVPAWAEE